MANQSPVLDGVFSALSDPTRRAVVARLGRGPAAVSELAGGFGMTLPSFLKHVRVLELSGLIRTTKSGRVRTCTLDRRQVAVVSDWLTEQRAVWEQRTNRLESFVSSSSTAETAEAAKGPEPKEMP